MDSMEINKGFAAVLTAGIAFMIASLIGDALVHPHPLKESAIKIEGAAAPDTANEAPAPLPPIAPLLASADPAAGESLTKKLCVSCHSFNDGGKAGVGPNLYGVVGLPHGHMEGFNYSTALKSKQGPWTFDELNEWLKKPSAYAPGTRMAFAGINNDKERANVIDYLRTNAKSPEPLPPVTPVATAPAVGPAKPAPGAVPAGAGAPPNAAPGTAASGSDATKPAQLTVPAANSGNSASGGTAGAAVAPSSQTDTEKAAGATTTAGPQGGAPQK